MPRVRLSSFLAIAALLGTTPPCFGADGSVYASSWSATHADSANSDYSPISGARSLALAWQREFGGATTLGATTDGSGRLFLTTAAAGCHLYALDAATGRTLWCSDVVGRLAVISAPLLDRDGHLFVADGQAMYAFSRDGALLWRQPIAGVPLSAQFTPAGRLIFVTNIGQIYILERLTGRHAMPPLALVPGATFDPCREVFACARGEAACPAANTPALSRGRLYFTFWSPGAANAGVKAMELKEGAQTSLKPLWTSETLAEGSASSPTLSADGSRLYVTDNGGRLVALDTATGVLMWTFPLGYKSGGSVSISPGGLIMPAGGGQSPVMAFMDKGNSAVLLWRRDDLINRGIAAQAAGQLAYATVSRGHFQNDLVVLDTRTGQSLDRTELPGTTIFSVGTTVGSDATVYVSTIRGTVFALRPR